MRNIFFAVAVLCIFATPDVRAQRRPPRISPPFRIHLPEAVDTKGLEITYYLIGPFGGYGGFVRTKAGVHEYVIETSYDGKPARSLKAAVYCPGYQVETLDYPSLAGPWERDAELRPKPLATVPFSGKVVLPARLRAAEVRVEVAVAASWECEFFGLMDCLYAPYKVTSAEVAEGGGFSVALPDFAHDPVVSSYKRPGEFIFTVSERKSGKRLFWLRPEGGSGMNGSIPISARYQDGRVFLPLAEK
jgi:hypothetical protein